jgi:2-aminobenzoate-CoA ligase
MEGSFLKETYPFESQEVRNFLVPPEHQPEFIYEQGLMSPEFFNLSAELIDVHTDEGRGNRVAIINNDTGDKYTYGQLKEQSDEVAAVLLSKGLKKGDRVAYRFPNRPETIFIIYGIWKAGGIVVLTPPQARETEIAFFLNDTHARFYMVYNAGEYYSEAVKALPNVNGLESMIAYPTSPDENIESYADLAKQVSLEGFQPVVRHREDVALVWHTGGTTGVPKACYHTTGRIYAISKVSARSFAFAYHDICVNPMPIGHAAGFVGRITAILPSGATLLETENMDPVKLYEGIQKHKVTSVIAMPITWMRFLDICKTNDDFSITEHIGKAYAPFLTSTSERLHMEWREKGVMLTNMYGSTAFAGWILQPSSSVIEKVNPPALGRPVYGFVAVAVQDEVLKEVNARVHFLRPNEVGILAIKGPTGLTYWNRPQKQLENQRDGFNVIDDIISIDEKGIIHYLGRSDFLITTSGYKVAPAEVEDVLTHHSAVKEVAVVGSPDETRGEVVMAYIVLSNGHQESNDLIKELQEFVKERISPYKYPRRIQFLPELPRDLVGKVQVKQLLQMAKA